MVAVEAMACATPVVVTSACGIAEHLELLGHGWVVPPDDPDALGEALRPLLENPDYARSRGEEALSFARAYFSPRAAAQARIALYRELMRPRIG
jgi:glycosyltransferase involved in cell wall biosynthesis